jgi:phytanoyl-CoA hydroxylase
MFMTEQAQRAAFPKPHPLNRDFVWRDTVAKVPRRLSADQAARFSQDGFVKLEGVFTPEEIAAVTAAIDPIEEEQERYVREQQGGRVRLSQADIITFTTHIVRNSRVLRDFAAHPATKDICHDLIGPDVRLYWDQSVYKKTGKPQEFPWHQDNGYTFVLPQQYLTLWIPLVDVDAENGCPWIAPGRHRLGTLEHWFTDIGLKCLEDVPDAVCVPAKAGDVIVFSSLAPHRTGPNLRTGTVRKAYILQYAPDGAYAPQPDGGRIAMSDPERQFSILDGGH